MGCTSGKIGANCSSRSAVDFSPHEPKSKEDARRWPLGRRIFLFVGHRSTGKVPLVYLKSRIHPKLERYEVEPSWLSR
jgi:hypothetical protein